MEKKDRMLEHIKNNARWLMQTDTYEFIPYYELSASTFSRVKDYIASDAQYNDVVCLISTSVFSNGKSGILFTTDYVYSRNWGPLNKIYKNSISSYATTEFDYANDFYSDRMRELMSDLYGIERKCEKERKQEERLNTGKKIGGAVLGGMALLEALDEISDLFVSQNNDNIADEINQLDSYNEEINQLDSYNDEINIAMEIYDSYFPLVNRLNYLAEENDDSEETLYEVTCILNHILLKLYGEVNDYLDMQEDDENYTYFLHWLEFWALMFYDNKGFRENYPTKELEDMPELWDEIAAIMDSLLEDEGWEESFSDILFDFGEEVIYNLVELYEATKKSNFNEDDYRKIGKILESNDRALYKLEDALDRATDCLYLLIPDED